MVTVGQYRVSIRWENLADFAWVAGALTLAVTIFYTVGFLIFEHSDSTLQVDGTLPTFAILAVIGAMATAAILFLIIVTVALIALVLEGLFRVEKIDQEADDG